MKLKTVLLLSAVLLLLAGCGEKKQTVEIDPNAVIIDPNATAAPTTAPKAEPTAAPAATNAPIPESFPAQEELTDLAEEDPYTFTAGNVKILPRMEAEPILAALGTPAFTFEADSCAYQGKDVYYKYSGFELTVNTPEGTPVITAITVVDDTIRVPFKNGTLAIGDSTDTLCSVLGVEAGQEQYDLHSSGVHLQVAVKDGRVSAILFLAPEEY